MIRWAPTLFLIAGCAKPVPAHLALSVPDEDHETEAPLVDLASVLAFMIDGDPLSRRPRFPDEEALPDNAEGLEVITGFIAAVRQLEMGRGERVGTLQRLAREHAGTSVQPLARGYALGIAERPLAQPDPQMDEMVEALSLLTGLPPGSADAPAQARHPFAWLGAEDDTRLVRNYADRWVLTGWLDAPDIPIESVATALTATQFTLLADSPTAKLITARAKGASTPTPGAFDDLARATLLSLTRAAADTDRELGNWADQKHEIGQGLGTTDPVNFLLDRAFSGLIANAADDKDAAAAMLAIQADRWHETCAWTPCAGTDRISAMTAAGRWNAEVHDLVRIWQVIALKDAVDSMDVGHDTVLFPKALLQLTDALNGLGAGPLDITLLRWNRPDPHAWESLGAAVGREGTSDWDTVSLAVGGFLQNEANSVAEQTDDAAITSLLRRIAKRALK